MSLKNKKKDTLPINKKEKDGLVFFHCYVMSLLNEYADSVLIGEFESVEKLPPVNKDIVIAYASATFGGFRKRIAKKYKLS